MSIREQFRIEEERQTPLEGFHNWADGKDCVGAFLIRRVRNGVGYWFLFIAHRENDNFYLNIVEKGQYVLELHKCENENNREFMTWKYGYEEFVEGLRPDTGPGNPTEGKEERKGEIGAGFRLVATDGVLKRIAKIAKGARSREVRTAPGDLTGRQVFKMALGNPEEGGEHDDIFEACMENGCALLGSWGRGEVDLSDPRFESPDEIFTRLQNLDPDITKREGMYQSLRYFRCTMKATYLVVVPDRRKRFRAVGEFTGEYQFVTGNKYAYCHRLIFITETYPREYRKNHRSCQCILCIHCVSRTVGEALFRRLHV